MIYLKSNISMEDWVALVHEGKPKDDIWKEDWVESARDRVHNLDLNISEHEEIYNQNVKTFIMFNEVEWERDKNQIPIKPIINREVYDDTATPPNRTIGFGFNMDAPSAKQEWEEVFGNSKDLFGNCTKVKVTPYCK